MNTVEQIIDAVSIVTGVSHQVMCKRNRKREIVQARYMCYYLMRKETTLSLKQIADYFPGAGGVGTKRVNGIKIKTESHFPDHSSIIAGLKTADDLLAFDKSFKSMFDKVTANMTRTKKGDKSLEKESAAYLSLAKHGSNFDAWRRVKAI